jgi:MarR family transcriptional regulator, 2-MHQ and catechol-resistance regulon repressor
VGDRKIDRQLEAFVLLVSANATLTRSLSRELEAECGIPLTWFEVLVRLTRAPEGHLRLTDLAGSLMLSSSGTTRLVDRIEAAGLIERVACPGDRRVVHVGLTEQGEELLEAATPVHRRGIERQLGRLSTGELTDLCEALRRLTPAEDAADAKACATDGLSRRRGTATASARSA